MSTKTIETGSVPTTEELEKAAREKEQAEREEAARNEGLVGHQGNKTTLVAGTTKLVKIRALRAIDYKGVTLAPGETAEVSEEIAKEFCDKSFAGGFDFGGERGDGAATRHKFVRAERV